jgi:hypothetical protein
VVGALLLTEGLKAYLLNSGRCPKLSDAMGPAGERQADTLRQRRADEVSHKTGGFSLFFSRNLGIVSGVDDQAQRRPGSLRLQYTYRLSEAMHERSHVLLRIGMRRGY